MALPSFSGLLGVAGGNGIPLRSPNESRANEKPAGGAYEEQSANFAERMEFES